MTEDIKVVADMTTNLLLKVAKNGNIFFMNNKAACIFRNIGGEANIYDCVAKTHAAVLRQNIDSALYLQHSHHFYWSCQSRYYLVYVYPEDFGVWLCMDDISEKRELAHLLHIGLQRLTFAERMVPFGYWELDMVAKRFYWSDEMYRIFEVINNNQFLRRNLIRECVYPDDLVIYKQKLKALLSGEQDVAGRIRLRTMRGRLKYCYFAAGIIYESGEARIAGIFQDITAFIERQNIGKMNKSPDFAMHFYHDIRLLLQNMKIAIENDGCHADSGLTADNRVTAQIDRLTNMLDNFINRTQSGQGPMVVRKQNFDLGQVLADICREYQRQASGREICLSCQKRHVWVNSDRFLIERLIHNLLSNALKYAKRFVKIGVNGSGFWIADDGAGIEKEKQKHIFDMFYRCNTLIDKHSYGTGIGLSSVKAVCQLIGAEVKVKSVFGKYTVFRICLP